MMQHAIKQQAVTADLKQFLDDGFSSHAVQQTGMDGCKDEPVAFTVYDGKEIVAAVVARLFWGALHVKNVMVAEKARANGLARMLMERAHEYGCANKCTFAFVETMSFQASGFYQKLGYQTEFTRHGYAGGASFIYLKKELV